MDFRGLGKNADELKTIHERQALVFFDEGTVFGEEGAGFERMNLATPTAAVQDALERLARCYA
jgi:bifunctional pyridoxal-dependent enzyme with beta-cystathionase and maltose regulon repressor activities